MRCRVEDAEHRSPQNMASREKPSIRGAFVQPAADISIMRCAQRCSSLFVLIVKLETPVEFSCCSR